MPASACLTRPSPSGRLLVLTCFSTLSVHADAPIQTLALRLFANKSSLVHLDMDYIHLFTRNYIRGGAEVPLVWTGSSPVSDEHFRRRILQDVSSQVYV